MKVCKEIRVAMTRDAYHDSLDIVYGINKVLRHYGLDEISLQDVTITKNIVSDLTRIDPRLSESIINKIWPSVSSESVYHYTSIDAAERILNSGIFRLANLAKRYSDGEIVDFFKAHRLYGYLDNDSSGFPKYKSELMCNLFYASFTDSKLSLKQENYFWNNFAGPDGVRLTFAIKARNPDFRKIVYPSKPGKPIPLLKDLALAVEKLNGPRFLLSGISRLCAFYLDSCYAQENEYRALFKVWDKKSKPQPVGTGQDSYIEVPLSQENDTGYYLDITEVHSRTRPCMPNCYKFARRST